MYNIKQSKMIKIKTGVNEVKRLYQRVLANNGWTIVNFSKISLLSSFSDAQVGSIMTCKA